MKIIFFPPKISLFSSKKKKNASTLQLQRANNISLLSLQKLKREPIHSRPRAFSIKSVDNSSRTGKWRENLGFSIEKLDN